MDGCGLAPADGENAVAAAKTPFLDGLYEKYPHTTLGASGEDVGLPDGQMGNSEVGHLNIGAGRIVFQELSRINNAIKDGSIAKNEVFVKAMDDVKADGKTLHLMGLMSPGGVHSHMNHVEALVKMAAEHGVKTVRVHAFMDGRDVDPQSGAGYMSEFCAFLAKISEETGCDARVATVSGRYWAMDRDNRWERLEKAYNAMVCREGEEFACPVCAVSKSYENEVTDEFVVPCVIKGGAPVASGDSVVFFNFRPDRAREITRTFVDPDFTGFTRKNGFFPLTYVCMTQYDATMPNVEIAFKPQSLKNTLGEYVSDKGLKQLRIAETEKYAHVTFFFNGGVEKQYPGEDRILVKSPKVATYDLQPEMSAYEVTDKMVEAVKSGKYDMIILNFANCDMVGHTGVFDAAVKAVEAVDKCVGEVTDAVLNAGGVVFLTADHGNAEKMKNPDGSPFTAHTTNVVPFAVIGAGDVKLREGGCLADIAPTMLPYIGLPVPEEMTGKSMIAE